MSGASIRVVANRTGIPADTLRVWERRYGFPRPTRRPGGTRVYSEDDVARLELVHRALTQGYRPGEVVPLARVELERMVAAGATAPGTHAATGDLSLEGMLDALAADDLEGVRTMLRTSALLRGPRQFVLDVAHPLAVRVGDAWAAGRLHVRHEHALTSLLTTQLRLLLAASEDGPRAPVVVLATLPGESHALALDMIAVVLAATLAAPRLLGPDTPPADVTAAATALGADVVGLSISSASEPRATAKAVHAVARALPPDVQLWIGGGGVDALAIGQAARKVTSWADLDRALADARR